MRQRFFSPRVKKIGEVCRQLDVCENTYYRRRKEYSGLDVHQAKRLKELEKENAGLKKLVADLSLDIAILKVERWRKEYNQVRPHRSLGYRPPAPESIEPSIMDRAV